MKNITMKHTDKITGNQRKGNEEEAMLSRPSLGNKSRNRRQSMSYLTSVLVAAIMVLSPLFAYALPTGGTVVGGSATISNTSSTAMNINQYTDKTIINWNGFSISAGELVKFLQPSTASVALNRVTGMDPSVIMGQLSANGRIFLLNPNGIVFGPGSQIDVGGLLATTLKISDSDFMAGNYNFSQDPNSPLSYIINQGRIFINDNGFAVLVAPLVSNEGLIIANMGKVAIAGAEQFTVSFDGDGMISFVIPKPTSTEPGTVLMPADQVTDLIKAVVNTTGIVPAGQIIEENGVVKLVGASGIAINSGEIHVDGAAGHNAGSILIDSQQATVVATGSLLTANGVGDNSSGGEIRILSDMDTGFAGLYSGATLEAKGGTSGDGGFIELSAAKFLLSSGVDIDASAQNGLAGTFLLDPTDVNIVHADTATTDLTCTLGGGTYTCNNDATATNEILDATINSYLNEAGGGYNVTINTAGGGGGTGNITLMSDAVIDKSAGANAVTLTLNAVAAIVIDGKIHNSGGGALSLDFNAGGSITNGANAEITINGNADFTGSSITLGDQTPDTMSFGSLTFNSAGAVHIEEDSATQLAGTSTADSLVLKSSGAITNAASTSLNVTNNANFSGTSITLGGAGDTMNFGSLDFSSAGTVHIEENSDMNLNTGSGSTVTLMTTGAIIDNNGATLNITSTNLELRASGGIGTIADPIETQVGTLAANSSTSGDIAIAETDGLTIGTIGSTTGVSTTSGNIVITSGSAGITVNSLVSAGGAGNDIILDANGAGGNIVINANITAADDVQLQADGNITRTAGTVSGDQVFLDAVSYIGTSGAPIYTDANTLGARVTTAAGGVYMTDVDSGNNGMTIGIVNDLIAAGTFEGIYTFGGDVVVKMTSTNKILTVENNADGNDTIRTFNGNVTLVADDMDLQVNTDQAINSGSGTVTLYPYHTNGISLGQAGHTDGWLSLTDAELDEITTSNKLIIGDAVNSRNIQIWSDVSPDNLTSIQLINTGATPDITSVGTARLTETTIDLQCGYDIGAGTVNPLYLGATNLTASAVSNIFISNNVNLNAGPINAAMGYVYLDVTGTFNTTGTITAGLSWPAGGRSVTIQATGDITLNNDINTLGGIITINSSGGTINQTAGDVDSTNSFPGENITYTANDITLAGTTHAGSGIIYLLPNTGIAIRLGGGLANFGVSDAELDTLYSSNGVVIGNTSSGAITVDGNVTKPAGFDNLALITGANITDSGTAYKIGVTGNLTLDSATGITGSALTPVVSTALLVDSATLAARSRTSGNIYIDDSNVMTVSSALNASSAFNGVYTSSNGNIFLYTDDGLLTVNQPVAANGSGYAYLYAHGATLGQGQIIVNNTVSSGTDQVVLYADDYIEINDGISTAGGDFNFPGDFDIWIQTGRTSGGSGDIKHNDGTITTTSSGGIQIWAARDYTQDSSSGSPDINSAAYLTVAAGRDITIDPAMAGTFIDLRADDDIIIKGDLTATNGHIYIRANNDGILANDGDSGIYAGGNVIFDGTGGAITISANNNPNGVILVMGENIYSLGSSASSVVFNANGTTSSGTGDGLLPGFDFGLAMLASTNIGSATYPALFTANIPHGSFIDIADANLQFNSMGFSHAPATSPHLTFTQDALPPDGIGSIYIDPATIVNSGLDIIIIAPDAIHLTDASYTALGRIYVQSTGSSIDTGDGISLLSGTDGNILTSGDISLIAADYIKIGNNVTMDTGSVLPSTGNIILTAGSYIYVGYGGSQRTALGHIIYTANGGPTSGTDAPTGTITFEGPATALDLPTQLLSDFDIRLTAAAYIDADAAFVPGTGYFEAKTGSSLYNGAFTLGEHGSLDVKGTLTFSGATTTQNYVQLINSAGTDLITINGSVKATNSIIMDLTGNDILSNPLTGNIALGDGSLIETPLDVTILTNASGAYGVSGPGDINGRRITITAPNVGADIAVGDINATQWILFTAGHNIETGNLTAAMNNVATADADNASGYAIKLTAGGDVVVGGTITANSIADLNVQIDPVNVTLGTTNVSGDVDVFATDNINVTGDVTSTGGHIWLFASSTNLTPTSDNNGVGDFTSNTGVTIKANTGDVAITGENVTLGGKVYAGNAVTVTSDFDSATDGGTTMTLYDDITGLAGVTLTSRTAPLSNLNIDLKSDVTVSATGTGAISMLTHALDGPYDLVVQTGSGPVSLGTMGGVTPLDTLTVSTSGITTLNGPITADLGIDMSGATGGIALNTQDITLTTTTGNIHVDGSQIYGAEGLTLTSTTGDIFILSVGPTPAPNSLTVSTAGTAYLKGDISVVKPSGTIDMSGTATILLENNVTMTGWGGIDLGSKDSTSIVESGTRTLSLDAGGMPIALDDVNITTLNFIDGGSNTLYGDITVQNAVDFSKAGRTWLAENVKVTTSNDAVTFGAVDAVGGGLDQEGLEVQAGTGLVTLGAVGQSIPIGYLTINSGTVALGGPITVHNGADSTGDISITTSLGDISVQNNITTDGAGLIDLNSGLNDILIGTTAAATVTGVNGQITLTGVDVTLGNGAGNNGSVTTLSGTGNIKVDSSGIVTVNNGSSIRSGGWLNIDPISVINAGILSATDYITITASDLVDNQSTGLILTTDNNSYVVIDAGKTINQNGNITTSTAGGSEYVSLYTAGAITDTTSNTSKIQTKTLNIYNAASVGAAGANNALDVDISTLYTNNVNGGIYIDNNSTVAVNATLNLLSVSNVNGDIVVNSNKTILATFVQAGGSGNITLTASAGDILVGLVDATPSDGLGNVTLTSAAGAIIDNNGALMNIVGNDLIISAVNGIGSSDALETQVSRLQATNTNNGIFIVNTGALEIVDLGAGYGVLNTSGWVNITAASPLLVSSSVTAGGNINLTAAGDPNTKDDNLVINADITSTGGGNITLSAGDDIYQYTGTTVSTNGGDISATADTEGGPTSDNQRGRFYQEDGATFDSGGGNITVSAYSATISLLEAWDGGTTFGNVEITATGGSILRSTSDDTVNVIADQLTMTAATGIGTCLEPIVTDVTSVNATLTTKGGIFIHEVDTVTDDGLVISGISVSAGSTVVVQVDHNNLQIETDINTGTSGAVALYASEGAITTDGVSVITAKDLILSAHNDIGSSVNNILTDVTNIAAHSDTGNIYIDEVDTATQDGLTVADVTVDCCSPMSGITSGGGHIVITVEQNNLNINADINAGTGGTVELYANDGAITDNGSGVVTAGDLIMDATEGIGTCEAPILTDVTTMDATTAAGGIFIHELDTVTDDGLVISGISVSAGSTVAIQVDHNDLQIETDINTGTSGAVALYALEGAITTDGVSVITAKDLILSAHNDIGDSVNNILTDVTNIAAHSDTGNIYIDELDTTTQDGLTVAKDVTVDCCSPMSGIISGGGLIIITVDQNNLNINADINAGADGTVELYANDGAITTDGNGLVTAYQLFMSAESGIGDAGAIQTEVSQLNAISYHNDINIDNRGDLDLIDWKGSPELAGHSIWAKDGSITISTMSDIEISDLVEATGSVYLYALDGSITDDLETVNDQNLDIKAGAGGGLYAGNGVIGWELHGLNPNDDDSWERDPIEVNISGGEFYVFASKMAGPYPVSVDLNGSIKPDGFPDVRDDWGVPPGLILFNNHVIGGGNVDDFYRSSMGDVLEKFYEFDEYLEWLLQSITDKDLDETLDKKDADYLIKKKKKGLFTYFKR